MNTQRGMNNFGSLQKKNIVLNGNHRPLKATKLHNKLPDQTKLVSLHCAIAVRSAALRASARSRLAVGRTDERTTTHRRETARYERLWVSCDFLSSESSWPPWHVLEKHQTITKRRRTNNTGTIWRFFLRIFTTTTEGERRLLKKTTEGILEKILVFYSVPNFFAQLSTLLHLPRYVIKVFFN